MFGVSNEFDQLTVLPPPTVLPAAMLTMPSAEGKKPPRRNRLLICRQFGLHEVGFVVVAARLEDDHPLAGFRQQRGGHSAAAAGADDDDIRLERRLTGGGDDLQRLAGIRRRVLGRARIFHADPQRIAAIRSRAGE